jgi:hypothetical protein
MIENPALSREEFADRVVRLLNDGALSLMLSIGHQAGLFDTMSGLPPSTSQKIADAAGPDMRRFCPYSSSA